MTTYKQAEELIDFHPGSVTGKAKKNFYLPTYVLGSLLVEQINKGNLCEYDQEKGTIKKIAPSDRTFIDPRMADNVDDAFEAFIDYLLADRSKMSNAEHISRSPRGALTGTGSCSESGNKSSYREWEEHMFGDLLSPPVQLDYTKNKDGTKTLSVTHLRCS